MKIILTSIGTRGDMEPFLACGQILKEKGHHVICAFPEQFRGMAESEGFEFASLGTKFIEMLESDAGKTALGGDGGGLNKFIAFFKLAVRQTGINKDLLFRQREITETEHPDKIVYNGKAMYPIIWGLKQPENIVQLSPVPYLHYVKNHTHVAFNSNYGSYLNKLTFALARFGLIKTLMMSNKWLGLTEQITKNQLKYALKTNKVIYTISPALFPRPSYWHKNMKVLGYHEKKTEQNFLPDRELREFMDENENILFITFGSMTNMKPNEKTKIFLEILNKYNLSAVINTASGGLVKPAGFQSKKILFVSQIPYNYIFPKVYAVVHHGGTGTTHLALKYGCPQMILPHIIDQFVWNKMIFERRLGPKGIKVAKISTKNLSPKILELMNNALYGKNASMVAEQIKKEDFTEELYHAVTE